MTFRIIDNKTGKEPTDRVISNIGRKGGLMEMDIDGFYVAEDGQIILVDDCGRCTWVDAKRFRVEPETGHWITKDGKEQGYDIGGLKTWYIQIMCSKCGFIKLAIEGHTGQYNYCPNCGTKMVEPQESEV